MAGKSNRGNPNSNPDPYANSNTCVAYTPGNTNAHTDWHANDDSDADEHAHSHAYANQHADC